MFGGVDLGLSATHVFIVSPPITDREPGISIECWNSGSAAIEIYLLSEQAAIIAFVVWPMLFSLIFADV